MGGAPEIFGTIGLSGVTGFFVAIYRAYKNRSLKKPKIDYLFILFIGGLVAILAVVTHSDWADKNDPIGSLIGGTIMISFYIFAGYYPGYLIGQRLKIK